MSVYCSNVSVYSSNVSVLQSSNVRIPQMSVYCSPQMSEFLKCQCIAVCGSVLQCVAFSIMIVSCGKFSGLTLHDKWGAGVETQKNVRGEVEGWGRVPFNEPYAPSLSTIYDGA